MKKRINGTLQIVLPCDEETLLEALHMMAVSIRYQKRCPVRIYAPPRSPNERPVCLNPRPQRRFSSLK